MMLNSFDMMGDSSISMTTVQYQTKINAPVDLVYEYYTNPNNIQEAPSRYSNCRVFKTRSFFFVENAVKIFLSVICHLFF
jgi:ligand-binding SRPBCC domain-containing protein